MRTARHFYAVSLFACLVFMLLWSVSVVAVSSPGSELLRPADTSSPRDTLTSFIADANKYIEDFRHGQVGEKSYFAFRRASQALDYSTTADGDSWFIRSLRIALLQEILARIELPSENEVPGDREVTEGNISQWKIPNTTITIVKIVDSTGADQYLFSAETVQELDSLYRQVKHLPYRPGTVVGLYEEMIKVDSQLLNQEQLLRDRLKPADTSSPRSTLEGFLENVNRGYALVTEANTALQATPPTMTPEQARELEHSAKQFLQRASDTFDLSLIPETLRQALSVDHSLKLKEIFDRMLLPPLDAIPTQQMIDSLRKEAQISAQQPAPPFRWKMPNTKIEIVEIQEGDRQGQFLFSAGTVRRVGDIYNKVKDLPYRKPYFGGTEQEYLSPDLSPDFYTNYISASGYLIPQLHLRGRLIEVLPNWVKAKIGKQMLWQWIGLLFSVLVALYVIFTVIRYVKLAADHFKSPQIDWLRLMAAVLLLIFFALLDQFVEEALNLSGHLRVIVAMLSSALIFLVAAWLTFLFCRTIAETIVSTSPLHTMSSESSLLRISASVVGFLIAVGIIINGFKTLGADLVPLLAGLGIGGLAVALAAQSSIANFIGGLILLSNKPVRVGDFCRYGEDPSADWLRIGTIEEINWISTRIRGIDRTVTTIPNAEFANMHIVNLSRRDQRLMRTTLQLRYETTPEQMRYILVKLRELLLGHPMVSAEPARVRLTGFAAYSKDIEIYGYLKCTEQHEFLAIQEDLLMRIEDIITEAGSGFAFPSQTAYLARDKGLDDERRKEAETQVDHLRLTNKLPFPEFEEEVRKQIENTLDYPPEGSPHHKSYK